MSATDRASAILLGLVCGDALGRPVEFRSATRIKQEFGQLDEMIDNGTHNQPAGTITDDTELALRIARSLIEEKNSIEPTLLNDSSSGTKVVRLISD